MRDEEITIDHFSTIAESEPLAILTFQFPAHRLQDENSLDEPIVWSVMLESMIHGQLELALIRATGR